MNGIYSMYYTGIAGSGHAVFILKDGVIAGADATGGVLDGTYRNTSDGNLDFSATMIAPQGTWLVTGAVAEKEPLKQRISAILPPDLGNGHPVVITTPTGPVNVIFKRIRSIP